MNSSSSLHRVAALGALLVVLALLRVSAIEQSARSSDPLPPPLTASVSAEEAVDPDAFSAFVLTGGLVPDVAADAPDSLFAHTRHAPRDTAPSF